MNRILNNNYLLTFLLALIAGIVFIPLIGNCPLFDWDEINFAECAREMIVTGNYSKVQINYQPFWEKPPFFIWMQALSMNIFGVNEFAARLPNAICGIFTIVSLYLIGKKFFSQKFGLLWALVHTGTLLPLLYFKSGVIDPWFNYFIFLSIILFIAAINSNSKKWLLAALSGIILGIAVLTKGPAALLIEGVTLFIYLILSNNLKFMLQPLFYFYVFIILFTSASWFLFEYLTGNSYIVEQFINYQIRLFETEDSGHSGPFIYHAVVLLLGCFPTSILFILSYKSKKELTLVQSQTRLIMLILFWVVLILFSIVKTKIVHYSSLCYFPITFIATFGLLHKDLQAKFRSTIKFLFIFIAVVFFILFMGLTQSNHIIPFLLKNNLIKDEFAKLNLQAELIWVGYEWLIPLVFSAAMLAIYRGLKTNQLNYMVIGFALNILFLVGAINTFVPKAELVSQHAAITFYKEVAKHDCYVESNNFKSYASMFYSDRRPHHFASRSHKDFVANFYAHQEKGAFLLNYYGTANTFWMKEGEIDKPAFLVCKTPDEANLTQHQGVVKLYSQNGFSFFVRMPKYDK
ncbi:MAG: ArnT family glycosyltransferase [Sphingobacteriaceae bacterium]